MRPLRAAPACLLALALSGCGRSFNEGKLEGTRWVSVAQSIQGPASPEGFVRLEFGTDKKFVHQIGTSVYTGKYSVDSVNKVTFHYAEPIGKSKKQVRKIHVQGDELVMSADGTSIKFRRAP